MEASVIPLVPRPPTLTASAARQLTDSIRADMETLWARYVSAHDLNAHGVLGYASWHAYCKAEFGIGQTRAYQLLDAGRVARAIGHSTNGGTAPSSERVARELVPLLSEGDEAVAEAWGETVEEHGPKPTAKQTAAKVAEKRAKRKAPPDPGPAPPEPDPEPPAGSWRTNPKLTKAQLQFGRNLSMMNNCAEFVQERLAGRKVAEQAATRELLDGLDDATRTEWLAYVKTIDNAARQLRRRLPREDEKSER